MVIGATTMTNSDFLAELLGDLTSGTHGWVCTFRADPSKAPPDVWSGRPYRGLPAQAGLIDKADRDNTYFCTGVLRATDDGEIVRRKEAFVRLAVLLLDDVQMDDVKGYSYAIQTSPGKFQVGILLDPADPDTANQALIDRVMSALAARGRSNDASGNALVRYGRLPVGCNTKPRAAGTWQVQLESWQPKVRWSLADACDAVGIDLDALRATVTRTAERSSTHAGTGTHAGEFLQGLTGAPSERAYHDSLTRMAASLVAGGMFAGAAVEHLYSLMDAVRPTGPEEEVRRWEARRAEIPRAVRSAEKFAPDERKPPSITVNLGLPKKEDGQEDTSALLMSLEQLQAKAGNVRWQVKHMIPDNSMGMLFGASGTYKSFIALDHSLHVAHGMQWMGKRTKQGRVVYLAAEGGAGIYRRVQAWHQQHQLPLATNFHVCITPMVLSHQEHVKVLAGAIASLPEAPALVYVDTLSQTFDGEENSANDISNYLRTINSAIRARFGCTVVVIHHSGHAASERPRGSSAITANVDFLIGTYKPEGSSLIARLDVAKQKDGDRLANLSFRLSRVVLGHDEDGEEVSSLACQYNNNAAAIMATGMARLAGHEQVLMRLVTEAGGQMADKDLRFAFYNHLGQEAIRGGKVYVQDTAKKAYARAYGTLNEKGLLSMNTAGTVSVPGQEPGHETGHAGT
jgi:hypothetical protein